MVGGDSFDFLRTISPCGSGESLFLNDDPNRCILVLPLPPPPLLLAKELGVLGPVLGGVVAAAIILLFGFVGDGDGDGLSTPVVKIRNDEGRLSDDDDSVVVGIIDLVMIC
mgnify:CR=1 FL=1